MTEIACEFCGTLFDEDEAWEEDGYLFCSDQCMDDYITDCKNENNYTEDEEGEED